jgi:predicted metal-binding membrane protein
MSTAGAATRRGRVPPVLVAAIAAAWALALAAQAAGSGAALHHDALLEGDLPRLAAVLLFLAAWQVMVAATMLPASLPLVRHFAAAAGDQERPRAALGAFLAGYALVWGLFGTLAFAADAALHELVHRSTWLSSHQEVIGGAVLIAAGAFQFTNLKERCLRVCRHPAGFMLRFYERGAGGGFRLGRRHGAFCLGCCWALMLVMFAAGMASLWWMAALAALMVVEKGTSWGPRTVPVTGVALIALGAAVLAQPAWLPGALTAPL